jgi:hypothetical protein
VKHLIYTLMKGKNQNLTSIAKNHKTSTTLVAVAAVLLVSTLAIGTGHTAFAHNDKNTKVFENSRTNIQTDTNQRQECETAGGTSPISGSCTAASSNTITQSGGDTMAATQAAAAKTTTTPRPPPTMHPTVLTLTVSVPRFVMLTAKLTDTITSTGVSGATITFIGTGGTNGITAVTGADGTVTVDSGRPPPGTYTVFASFLGTAIYGPSNSAIQTFTVPP